MKKGTRVTITKGLTEFIGQIGTITSTERHGGVLYFRVWLDNPIEVDGVGPVRSDIWTKDGLQVIA